MTRRLKKIPQILEKVAKKVAKPKFAQVSTLKLNLKVRNIYIKQLLKPKNTYNKPYSVAAYLAENVKKCLRKM